MTDFDLLKFRDETECVNDLLNALSHIEPQKNQVEQRARVFIETIRNRKTDLKGFNALMQSYDLTSDEGLALMTLAEALLRIPDTQTANAMIEDKLSDGDWRSLFDQAGSFMGKISGIGLSLSQSVMDSMIGKIGMPFIRKACIEAMQMMGHTFVLGRDIDEAIKHAQKSIDRGYIYNFDMLGEGARTKHDAEFYFNAYANAIQQIGKSLSFDQNIVLHRPGISIKLSALYPRYEFSHYDDAVKILADKLHDLCVIAAQYHLNLTVDAEECDRLSISLDIIETVLQRPLMKKWDGFGLAVQAYQKRALSVIDRIIHWSKEINQKISVRLVKGAYWDSEIKHAQIEGHIDYPVFTRKENTDLSYLACAKKLLDNRDYLYTMFGTHNAQTVASILEMAGNHANHRNSFMFQRLHGMGEALYDQLLSMEIPVCVYAPVGTHKYLLAYLVRRLLENGANSSFVNKIYDSAIDIDRLIQNPIESVCAHEGQSHSHPKIPLPQDIYHLRHNSKGMDLSENPDLLPLYETIKNMEEETIHAPNIINGKPVETALIYKNMNPSNQHDCIGNIFYAREKDINYAYEKLSQGFLKWNKIDVTFRSDILNKIGDLYEENRDELMAILIREAGKTIPDAIAEIREAVDFCRYYALQALNQFTPQILEGPTGEINSLTLEGRGIFACISPWNFPLAIFTGQVVAALVAGNAVISKPAEQTPAIATLAIRLMIQAGVPEDAISLLHGDGEVGSAIINHQSLGGVAFTGSTDVAKIIQRQLAEKEGAIIPLIAETGGLNAMIVDSTSLPEQVTDDVLHSAFGSAGQRCSALRILCIQDDVADEIIPMIKGAIDYLNVGDPSHLSTDIGPIIDEEAKNNLVHYRLKLEGQSKSFYATPYDERLDSYGTYFAPVMAELNSLDMIEREAFGPILHIIRYKESNLDQLIDMINAKGYGLTFGLHSRIQKRQTYLADKIMAGNIYINRGQTGAVVGVQPFGGRGLSGTGPKAGGPYYLHAFACEKSISDNITASGGNATLINL